MIEINPRFKAFMFTSPFPGRLRPASESNKTAPVPGRLLRGANDRLVVVSSEFRRNYGLQPPGLERCIANGAANYWQIDVALA